VPAIRRTTLAALALSVAAVACGRVGYASVDQRAPMDGATRADALGPLDAPAQDMETPSVEAGPGVDASLDTDAAANGMDGSVMSCAMGFADCDREPANGCETAILFDETNCNGCGTRCMPDFLCCEGCCALVPDCRRGALPCL